MKTIGDAKAGERIYLGDGIFARKKKDGTKVRAVGITAVNGVIESTYRPSRS